MLSSEVRSRYARSTHVIRIFYNTVQVFITVLYADTGKQCKPFQDIFVLFQGRRSAGPGPGETGGHDPIPAATQRASQSQNHRPLRGE